MQQRNTARLCPINADLTPHNLVRPLISCGQKKERGIMGQKATAPANKGQLESFEIVED